MGYAGYSPGFRTAEELPPLQQTLRAIPLENAQETLELIEKLVRNIVSKPSEDKFRKIRLTNPKIAEAITNVPAAMVALTEMGWQQEGENLVLPNSTKLAFETHVRAIQDTQDFFKKEIEKEKKRKLQALKQNHDPDKENLRKQIEADRKEKEAEGPVTHSSKAQQLGNGPNVMRAGDLGIGKSSGG